LQDLLTQFFVLIRVLDADKHYWIGKDEVEKLLRHGEGWLQAQPDRLRAKKEDYREATCPRPHLRKSLRKQSWEFRLGIRV
jgi:RNA repair, ligase-Pnkp-associating, region of Hen1